MVSAVAPRAVAALPSAVETYIRERREARDGPGAGAHAARQGHRPGGPAPPQQWTGLAPRDDGRSHTPCGFNRQYASDIRLGRIGSLRSA